MSGADSTGEDAPGGGARCPACGTDTAVERSAEPEIGGLSVDEVETLARNEWRRRVGPEAYRRPHRREFVRSLLVFSLNPESPVRRLVLEEALWEEVASLEAWGLSRRDAEVELYRLAHALWTVLEKTEMSEDRRRELMLRMDDRIRAELGWPELEWGQVREIEGPIF
jgi:hypothetical protein